MKLATIIDARSIFANLKAQNKKLLLQDLAQAASTIIPVDARTIFETLLRREKLGSTGLGQGIAIPHGKLPSLHRVHGFFAKLPQPVDFDSIDNQPVDLVFMLLAPEEAGADHLMALAQISRLLRDPIILAKLRGTDSAAGLYAILTEPTVTATAA
jgi:PTS system nitrogen regulatory IIA component